MQSYRVWTSMNFWLLTFCVFSRQYSPGLLLKLEKKYESNGLNLEGAPIVMFTAHNVSGHWRKTYLFWKNCRQQCLVTDPGAIVGLRLQLGDLGDLLEEVRLLHPRLGAAPLELRPRVGQDHLEVHCEAWRTEKREEGKGKGGCWG